MVRVPQLGRLLGAQLQPLERGRDASGSREIDGATPTSPESSSTRVTSRFAPTSTSLPPLGASLWSIHTSRPSAELSAYVTSREVEDHVAAPAADGGIERAADLGHERDVHLAVEMDDADAPRSILESIRTLMRPCLTLWEIHPAPLILPKSPRASNRVPPFVSPSRKRTTSTAASSRSRLAANRSTAAISRSRDLAAALPPPRSARRTRPSPKNLPVARASVTPSVYSSSAAPGPRAPRTPPGTRHRRYRRGRDRSAARRSDVPLAAAGAAAPADVRRRRTSEVPVRRCRGTRPTPSRCRAASPALRHHPVQLARARRPVRARRRSSRAARSGSCSSSSPRTRPCPRRRR